MSTKKSAQASIVFITARYAVKSSGSIVCVVRSISKDTTNDYNVTLNKNGSHSCTCPGKAVYNLSCKHIRHCVEREESRAEAKKVKQLRADNPRQEELDAVVSAIAAVSPTVAPLLKTASDTATLRGNGKGGFSLLKKS